MVKIYRNANSKAEPAKMKRTSSPEDRLKDRKEKYRRNEKRWVRKVRYFRQK